MSSEEYLRSLKNISSKKEIDFSCSSCRQEYKSHGDIKYCTRCQEYLFIPGMEETNDSATLASDETRDIDTTYTLDSNIAIGEPRVQGSADGSSQSECSVWSCSVNLPVVSAAGCSVPDNLMVNIGKHSSDGYSVCNNHTTKSNQAVGIKYQMEHEIRRLEEVEKRQQNHRDELKQMKKDCLTNIKSFRAELNETIERLEQAAITELENTFQEIDNVLKGKLNDIEEALNVLRKSNDNRKLGLSQHLENKQFYEYVLKSEELVREHEVVQELVFIKNTKLLEILESFSFLGFCEYQEKQGLYRIQSMETKTIKHENDKEDCSIHSCCFLDSGDILMADYKNKNIKVLDGTMYDVKDLLPVEKYPLSVCKVSEKEAAVALAETRYFGGDSFIQFISTEDKLVPTRSIRLDHCCTGISVIRDQIFVSNERKRLFTYSLEGKHLDTIYLDQLGNEIFSKCYAIIESDNEKMVHVTDLNKGLITLDREGHLMWKYSGPEMQMAWGVCTDGKGNIFVSGGNSSNVVQIGAGGNYLGEVVSESLNIKDPQAICFDKNKSRLILTRYNCNSVHIFSIL